MNRQEQALALAEEILTDIELSRIDTGKILYKASRLARLMRDTNASWIDKEIRGYESGSVADDEQLRLSRRWRTEEEAYTAPLPQIQAMADTLTAQQVAQSAVSFSGDMILPALDKHNAQLAGRSQVLTTLQRILSTVASRLYDYAVTTYHELKFGQVQEEMFEHIRSDIDSRLANAAERDSFKKVQAINERLRDGDEEAASQALATCRRLIDSVAMGLFPPREEPFVVDGQPLKVKENHVLNRLAAAAAQAGASKSRRDRLRRAIGDIYEGTSKGVHSQVTIDEARFLFLQTYVVLGEYARVSAGSSDDSSGVPINGATRESEGA